MPWLLCAKEQAPPLSSEIGTLHYHAALYHFYQGDYFTSATQLLVAEKRGLLAGKNEEAELLLGGIYLAYGMVDAAEEIFKRLTTQLGEAKLRQSAWFHLAEIHYHKGRWSQALQALSEVGQALSPELLAKKEFFTGQLLLLERRYDEAIPLLSQLNRNSTWAYYGLYNLGVTLISAKREVEAQRYLTQLIELNFPASLEISTLQDKARLALGYSALVANDMARAKNHFSQVPLQSLHTDLALYGLGRAFYQTKEYANALIYWSESQGQQHGGAAALESQFASAQAYFQLAAYQQALDGFLTTINSGEKELNEINRTLEQFKERTTGTQVVATLAPLASGQPLAETALPFLQESYALVDLFASHAFIGLLNSYRDVQEQQRHLHRWLNDITVLREILATRRHGFESRLPVVLARHKALSIADLNRQSSELTHQIATITQHQASEQLATDTELQQHHRLVLAEKRLALLPGTVDSAKYQALQERVNRLNGLLKWRWATDYKIRLRHITKSNNELGDSIREATRLEKALSAAQQAAPAQFNGYAQRIDALTIETQRLLTAAETTHQALERQIIQEIGARLENRKTLLTTYLTKARFAAAQIYDMSLMKK